MRRYCTKMDIQRRWGTTNVNTWADLENTESANAIATQIDWAIDAATTRINADLAASIYVVPFASTPPMVRLFAASLAGCILFKSRTMAATEDSATISKAEEEYQAWLTAVYSGVNIDGAVIVAEKGNC